MTDVKLTASQARYMAIPMETIVIERAPEATSPLIPSKTKEYWKTLQVPDEFDGRTKWNIVPPQDQGGCGSCWAYAGVTTLNDRFNIIGKLDLELSISQTVLCDWHGKDVFIPGEDEETVFRQLETARINKEVLADAACFGNTLYDTWRHLFVWGTTTNSCVPKTVLNEEEVSANEPLCAEVMGSNFDLCHDGTPARFYRSLSFYIVPGVEESGGSELVIRREMFKYGTVSTAIDIFQDFYALNPLQIYRYNGISPYVGGHAIVLVGWGEENGIKYWIARNSWGTKWCDGGFFRIERGVNMCNIEQNVYTGLPDFFTQDDDEPFDEQSQYQRYWYTGVEAVGGGHDPEYGYSRRILHTQVPLTMDLEPLVSSSPYKEWKSFVAGRRKTNWTTGLVVVIAILLLIFLIVRIS